VASEDDSTIPTKLVEADQTASDALWGYKDSHGKWTDGLVQRVGEIEKKQNWSIGLILVGLGKTVSPDIINGMKTLLVTATAWFH
jgi:hypothetical protein